MNFLLRSATSVVQDAPAVSEDHKSMQSITGPVKTLEGLIAEDPFPSSSDDGDKDNDGGVLGNLAVDPTAENHASIGSHSDVSEDEGWITIPYKELPEDWSDASDIHSFLSLDRQFVFPGEQLHILACLSASKQDTDVITPFRVAAVMCKNGSPARNSKQPAQVMDAEPRPGSEETDTSGDYQDVSSKNIEENGDNMVLPEVVDTQEDISATESLLRMESHKRRTQVLLENFRNSHFFARIAESDEPLWSRGNALEVNNGEPRKTLRKNGLFNAFIDRGNFDGNASGGVARNAVNCCALHNGDIVVLLQVNVGTDNMRDPVLEILQFEKFRSNEIDSGSHCSEAVTMAEDPYRELLTWLLPLDRALPPPGRPLSPPLASAPGIGSASQKSTAAAAAAAAAAASGSQLFSFGHFRSYSMPAMPQVTIPSTPVVQASNSKPNFDLEDFDRFSQEGTIKNKEVGMEGLLSFRGVPLEPQRFSARCGLEGIYLPGRRWRKKLEIIRPIEIHSFSAECNTEDLICVQIKNVSPAHMPDIIIYIDTITVVFEEAPKDGPPISLPISCIEAGNEYSLPNLALRRGEEHSFILKPATSLARDKKGCSDRSPLPTPLAGTSASSLQKLSRVADAIRVSSSNQYAVLVSCRCNYTESKLFFKKPISWRPRVVRDLMVSVASEISAQTFEQSGRLPQLPVQALTLQASNLTYEDLTLTVLAPASFTSLPSVMSLNSAPTSPMSPLTGFPDYIGRMGEDRQGSSMQGPSSMPLAERQQENSNGGPGPNSLNEHTTPGSGVIQSADLGCSHLWLQSTVPLGCVPAQSSTTAKLELLPLTDGIITLDTLQISVKEKGLTYIPEHPLKIHATSSIATGIV